MPELPELEVLAERLTEAVAGRVVARAAAFDPFVLRTVEPPLGSVVGRIAERAWRNGKETILQFDTSLSLDIHLMRAGRLRLRAPGPAAAKRRPLLLLEFEGGPRLEMTEAGKERRASVRVLAAGTSVPRAPGLDPLETGFTAAAFAEALRRENRRVKNALRDRDVVAGIGNAYSDEILHAARLSPLATTARLSDAEIEQLHAAVGRVLRDWVERVRAAVPPGSLPERQDLWRRQFSVHGKAGSPCPVCDTLVERISYRDSEACYCPSCQNEGRLHADRRLSRLGIRRETRRGRPG
jgi:formamidopyrimidine-DNA glycosylase